LTAFNYYPQPLSGQDFSLVAIGSTSHSLPQGFEPIAAK
jgi:hypothetical protein